MTLWNDIKVSLGEMKYVKRPILAAPKLGKRGNRVRPTPGEVGGRTRYQTQQRPVGPVWPNGSAKRVSFENRLSQIPRGVCHKSPGKNGVSQTKPISPITFIDIY